MDGLFVSAAAWVVSNIRWHDILCNMKARLAVSLCKDLAQMVDDNFIDNVCECCTIEESDLYEIFPFLLANDYHRGKYLVFLD